MINKIFDFIFDKVLDKFWGLLVSSGILASIVHLFDNIWFFRTFSFILLISLIIVIFITNKLSKSNTMLEQDNKNLLLKLDEEIIKHDMKIFEESDKIMSQELFESIINQQVNGMVLLNSQEIFQNYIEYFCIHGVTSNFNIRHTFKNKILKTTFEDFYKSFAKIYNHIAWDEDNRYLKIHSEKKYGSEECQKEYYETLNEIKIFVNESQNKYKDYRQAIKDILSV